MLRRSWRFLEPTFKTKVPSALAEDVVAKKRLVFDHIAIDIGDAVGQGIRLSSGDADCCRWVNRFVFFVMLGRVTPVKSMGIFFDGTQPAWKLAKSRKSGNKKVQERVHRSAGSQLMWEMETDLRRAALKNLRCEQVVVSGPGVPGSCEEKISRWQLDIASRPGATNDSFLSLGGSEGFYTMLARTPLHNMSHMTLHNKELKEVTLPTLLSHYGIDHLLGEETKVELAKLRCDLTFLQILVSGMAGMQVGANVIVGVQPLQIMEAYLKQALGTTPYYLFREDDQGDLALDIRSFLNLFEPRARESNLPNPLAMDAFELILQTHTMLITGTVRDPGFVPRDVDRSGNGQSAALGSWIHLCKKKLQQGHTTIKARSNPSWGLTAMEQLLASANTVERVKPFIGKIMGQNFDIKTDAVNTIVQQPGINEAVKEARSYIESFPQSNQLALAHQTSYCFTKSVGEKNSPMGQEGWKFHSVNLGVRGSKLNIREKAASSGGSMSFTKTASKSTLVEFNGGAWENSKNPFVTPADQNVVYPKTLKVVSYNVQFNRFSGQDTPLGKSGFDWCTKTRYVALAQVIKEQDADIVGMQEVEKEWWDYLSLEPWVQERYRFTATRNGDSINPWGLMMLIKKDLPLKEFAQVSVPGWTGHTNIMPIVRVATGPRSDVAVNSIHLLAPFKAGEENNRDNQIGTLKTKLEVKNIGSDVIIMGDFNDYPTKLLKFPEQLQLKDAWLQVHGRNEAMQGEVGYTINGNLNEMCGKIIEPEFFGRADRVHYRSEKLQPLSMELVGTRSVQEELAGQVSCPDYIWPSDHFGLSCTFRVL